MQYSLWTIEKELLVTRVNNHISQHILGTVEPTDTSSPLRTDSMRSKSINVCKASKSEGLAVA